MVETPLGLRELRADFLMHAVAKRSDARERYANFIIPTLRNPYEVYLSEYALPDGSKQLRERYIGLFRGAHDIMVVVRVGPDGGLFWNFVQAGDKAMNAHRVGELVYAR